MNTLQVCRQLQYLLSQKKWVAVDGTVGELCFASVVVTVGPPEDSEHALRAPLVIIRPLEADVDPQAPGAMRQSYEIVLAVQHTGDALGQSALVGGQRTGTGTQGQGSSVGRGLLELEEQLLDVITYLDQNSGLRLSVVRKSAAQAAFDPAEGYTVHRSYVVDSRTSVDRSYDAPLSLNGTNATGGNANLTWKNPPLRFDFDAQTIDNNQAIPLGARLELRRIAGATPPLFPNQNSGVGTGTLVQTWTPDTMPTSYQDSPGAGTWSYALAAAYDETGSGTQERWSDAPATISGLVVT